MTRKLPYSSIQSVIETILLFKFPLANKNALFITDVTFQVDFQTCTIIKLAHSTYTDKAESKKLIKLHFSEQWQKRRVRTLCHTYMYARLYSYLQHIYTCMSVFLSFFSISSRVAFCLLSSLPCFYTFLSIHT